METVYAHLCTHTVFGLEYSCFCSFFLVISVIIVFHSLLRVGNCIWLGEVGLTHPAHSPNSLPTFDLLLKMTRSQIRKSQENDLVPDIDLERQFL